MYIHNHKLEGSEKKTSLLSGLAIADLRVQSGVFIEAGLVS